MTKQNTNTILTVGSMAFDSIQTPSGNVDKVLGGSGNYFSIAASFYAPVQIVAVVGEDFPKSHLKNLQKRKIDVSGVNITEGKTFHWSGTYLENLNEAQTISTELNVFESFLPKLKDNHTNTPYVFLANIDPSLQLQVLDQVKSPRLIVLDSMNFWIQGKLKELKETIKKVDVFCINETEAKMLSGCAQLDQAARVIMKMGPKVIIIKRGEYGAALFTSKSIFLAPAFFVNKVVDPTGAGDSFGGAFVGYLASKEVDRKLAKSNPKKWDKVLRDAVIAGCVMSSFTVEDFSFNKLLRIKKRDLDKRKLDLLKMTRI